MSRTFVYQDIVLHECDLETLQPGHWLNDQVIEFGLAFFRDVSPKSTGRPTLTCVPPATCQLILHAPQIAGSIIDDLKLDSSKTPLLFCVNNATDVTRPLSGTHWSALVVTGSPQKTRHVHYDSMDGSNDRCAESLSAILQELLGDAQLVHERSFNGRQKNHSDCGVFLLAVAQAYMHSDDQGQAALDVRIAAIDQTLVDELRLRLLLAASSVDGDDFGHAPATHRCHQ